MKPPSAADAASAQNQQAPYKKRRHRRRRIAQSSLSCISIPCRIVYYEAMWALHQASSRLSTLIGIPDPLARPVSSSTRVWLFHNTAFQDPHARPRASSSTTTSSSSRSRSSRHNRYKSSSSSSTREPDADLPWTAEFVVAFSKHEADTRRLADTVAEIAHLLHIDSHSTCVDGDEETVHDRIARRVQPFLTRIAVGRTLELAFDVDPQQPRSKGATRFTLGPSKSNGISADEYALDGGARARTRVFADRDVSVSRALHVEEDGAITRMRTSFAGRRGWTVISDIDDTIKITLTRDRLGLLKSTFVDAPRTTEGLPEFYKLMDRALKPAWFYLSASPYELYPFLTHFLNKHYPEGTLILRDMSWQDLSSFVYSLTEGTQEYKQDRIAKVQARMPDRSYICLGDSTQTDPEAYGEMYRRRPGVIRRIYIRVVRGVDEHREQRLNSPARFAKAFRGVPEEVWSLYLDDEGPMQFAGDVARMAKDGYD